MRFFNPKPLIGLGLCVTGLIMASPLNATKANHTVTQQRFAMVLMDNRCHLLDGPVRMALQAGYIQARNQEIYQGRSYEYLRPQLEAAREEIMTIDCRAKIVGEEANRIKRAFRQTLNIYHQTYQGPGSEWRLDRSEALKDKWRLVQYQSSQNARLGFGLYGALEAPRFGVMIRFLDPDLSQKAPYSASLIMRDTQKAPTGLIHPRSEGLEETLPLGFEEMRIQKFTASNRVERSYGLQYHPRTNEFGVTLGRDVVGVMPIDEAFEFEFPTRAYLAMAQLDPREEVVIEFRFQDTVRYARLTIGDFFVGIAGIYRA
jgi:hypothetical protein